MSELVETIVTDFSRKHTLLGEGEQINKATLLDYIKPHQKFQFVYCDETQFGGDAKPPLRICNLPPPKTGEELAAEITEKMKKSSLRREQFLNNIVQKSRQYNEKVKKAKEKMAAKRVENTQNVEKELHDRRNAAEKTREKIFQDRMQKIKQHMEHSQIVKNRKIAKDSLSLTIHKAKENVDENSSDIHI